MKFFVCFALLAIVASALAAPSSSASATNVGAVTTNEENGPASDLTRLRKSAYGGSSGGGYGASSVPAPPCPKNYLFSCQPNLAPVPCSAPAQSYGSAGAYSSPIASYAAPNYALPQQQYYGAGYVPQAYGYQY